MQVFVEKSILSRNCLMADVFLHGFVHFCSYALFDFHYKQCFSDYKDFTFCEVQLTGVQYRWWVLNWWNASDIVCWWGCKFLCSSILHYTYTYMCIHMDGDDGDAGVACGVVLVSLLLALGVVVVLF